MGHAGRGEQRRDFLPECCDLLREFLLRLPKDIRPAFEFRHESWFADTTYAALRDNRAALCIAESEELATPPSGLHLNLSAVTFIDSAGINLLGDLIRRGATISACSGFVAELLRRNPSGR